MLKVAGILPCHNHEKWVGQAVRSLAAQTHPLSFAVLVDDGSTDGSADEARKAAREYGLDLRVVRHETPKGPAEARNAGMRAAWEADAFAFLDSDDLYGAFKVELSLKAMTPGVGAAYSDYLTLDAEDVSRRQWKPPFCRDLLRRECIVNMDSVVLKAAVDACGGFDPALRVCEDYDFWLSLSSRFMIAHVPEALVTVRVGPHSSTANVPSERWKQDHARVMAKEEARCRTAASSGS